MNPHSYRLKGRDFVHQGKIEIDVNERAVFIRTQGCFFVYTNSDCFLNSLSNYQNAQNNILYNQWAADLITRSSAIFYTYYGFHKFFSKEAFIAAKTRHPQSTQLEKPCLRQTEMRHSFRSAGSSLSHIPIP